MSSRFNKSVCNEVLEAAMGCLHALSKVSVDEEVRSMLLGKIFQSFGEVHSYEAHKCLRKMDDDNASWNKEQANGKLDFSSIMPQKMLPKRSMEEVRISSLFASLSEAVSQGSLDIKDFFSVVMLLEESVLKNSEKNEYAKNGILTVLQDKNHENDKNGSSLEKQNVAVSPVQDSSVVLFRGNVEVNEDVHVHGDEHEKIPRNYELSKSSKERENPFCPLDNRQSVNSMVVAPQGASVNAICPHHADPAGKVKSMPNTPSHASSFCSFFNLPFSKSAATVSDNFEKRECKKGTHVTSALPTQSFTENCPPTKGILGKPVPKPLSFLEAVKNKVYAPLENVSLFNQNIEGNSPQADVSQHNLRKSKPFENSTQQWNNSVCKSSQPPSYSPDGSPLFKIDPNVLHKRLEMCRFSVLGKLTLAKGDEPWPWAKLKDKLDVLWGMKSQWRLISLGKGFFHIVLSNKEDYERVWSKEILHLKPGVLRLQCWTFGHDHSNEKNSKAQVWFRIYNLPWCLWDESVISGIAGKIGVPLRIDRMTMEGNFGHYARILIEIDLSKPIMPSVLVDCGSHMIEVHLGPENLPSFCKGCNSIGHTAKECRMLLRTEKTPSSLISDHPQLPSGSKRVQRVIGNDERFGASSSKWNAQHSEWRRKKVQIMDNKKVQLEEKHKPKHAIVEIVTDFSAQMGSQSSIAKKTDVLVISNQFAVLETEVDAKEMVVDSAPLIQEVDKKDGEVDESYDQKSGEGDEKDANYIVEDIDRPIVPSRWSDLFDEEDTAVDPSPTQEANTAGMEPSLIIRTKPHDDCIWLNHDDDSKYDRDMCVERERYKNSARETRNFIANLPKKDKKVKIAFRQPQGRASSPKE